MTPLDHYRSAQPQTTAQGNVYAQLRAAILNGGFRPGEMVSVRRLAEAFGVSAMPVREAASRLAAEGSLEVVNRRGLIVPVLTPDRAQEILTLRIDLEGGAAEAAAAAMTKAELARLKTLQRRLCRTIELGERRELLTLNLAFHTLIYEAARNATLMTLIDMLLIRYMPTLALTAETMFPVADASARWIRATHDPIIAAIEARDGAAARRALVTDIGTASQLYWHDAVKV